MSQSNKIAVFLPSLGGGGAERAMLLFAHTAQDMGIETLLICAEKKGVLVPLLDDGLEVVDLNATRMVRAIFRLRSFLKREKPDAVFSTIVHANLALLLASWGLKNRPRIILRESNAPLSENRATISRRISHFLVPFLYPFADKIIAVSTRVRDELVRMCPKLVGRIEVLDTPVVSENIRLLAEQEPDHPWFAQSSKIILGVGRLHHQKNFALLIEAFSEVRKSKDCKLIILGHGALEDDLRALADRLGVGTEVSFVGFKLNPFSFMKRASVFALTSNYEGMPNVLIQAMALGTQVIATDCPGGCAECLDGGNLGLLIPVGDKGALTAAIVKALESTAERNVARIIGDRFGAESATRAYLKCSGIDFGVVHHSS